MAKAVSWNKNDGYVEAKPKKTRQGRSALTKYASSSRNSAKKKYRGQGR